MGHPLGRWQQILASALAEHSAVGVRAVVEAHMGREAARSERESYRRAAYLLSAAAGQRLCTWRCHLRPTAKGGTFLVVVRPDLDVLAWPDEASLQAIGIKPLPLARLSREALLSVVASLRTAAARLDHVEVDTIDIETAGQALDAIAEPLRRLNGLQRVLTLRRELGKKSR